MVQNPGQDTDMVLVHKLVVRANNIIRYSPILDCEPYHFLCLSPRVKLHDVVKTVWLQDCLVIPTGAIINACTNYSLHFRILGVVFHCCHTTCGSPRTRPNPTLHNSMTEMVTATLRTAPKNL